MAWQSVAEWQARHSPEYITAQQKLLMQRQIAHEVEDRRYQRDMDMFRHQSNMQEQRDRAREEAMLSVERERGKNRIAEINAEIDGKIRVLGTEAQIAAFNRLSEELAKNKDIFRDWMQKRTDFRAQAQMAIINALIALGS